MPKNILFIMCDQLRWDYLSCYGHPTLNTPNIDMLAERGVRFDRAYCQSPICGSSRASFYTGRYPSSHGVMANADVTRLDELTIADYLKSGGYRSAVVGKAHNRKSIEAMARLGIDPKSEFARHAGSGGFEPFELHDGLYPGNHLPLNHGYSRFLRQQGYDGRNPWNEYANSGVDENGKIHSGWQLRNSIYPSRVAEEHSETTFLTNRAIDFLEQQEEHRSWCLHLSYIKPHWPLIAPSPYHNRYQPGDIQPVLRSQHERQDPHPVYRAFMEQEYSESFTRDEVRQYAIPVYMGLIRQIDDQLGRLFSYMHGKGIFNQTMIVFTSDHGDYLGDHWLGEKDLFHEASARIPLIIANPDSSADATRGSICMEMVESIDLLPTFIEYAAGKLNQERLEGQSLMSLLASTKAPDHWRQYAVSEIDYSDRGPRSLLNLPPYDCRATMIRGQRWKYIHHRRFAPQLFDLQQDPDEFNDLGRDPAHEPERLEMLQRLADTRHRLKPRIGMPYDNLADMGPERDAANGVVIGRW